MGQERVQHTKRGEELEIGVWASAKPNVEMLLAAWGVSR